MGGESMNIKFPFTEIEGYLSANDREALRDLSAKCRHLPGVYVEIGSYKGLSANCIAEGFDRGRTLFCYDFFGDGKFEEFIRNTEGNGIVVAPVRGNFKDTLKLSQICFAFVDHSHTVDDTKAAVEMLWPRLSKGGLLLFHDYNHPDYMAATEFLDTLPYQTVETHDTGLMVFKKE
jgi:predicted O-methyltransferase YrrM